MTPYSEPFFNRTTVGLKLGPGIAPRVGKLLFNRTTVGLKRIIVARQGRPQRNF